MAQNFWTAIFAWTACFVVTIVVSLVTQAARRARAARAGLLADRGRATSALRVVPAARPRSAWSCSGSRSCSTSSSGVMGLDLRLPIGLMFSIVGVAARRLRPGSAIRRSTRDRSASTSTSGGACCSSLRRAACRCRRAGRTHRDDPADPRAKWPGSACGEVSCHEAARVSCSRGDSRSHKRSTVNPSERRASPPSASTARAERRRSGSRLERFVLPIADRQPDGRRFAIKEVVLFDVELALPPQPALYGEGFQMLTQTGGTLGAAHRSQPYTDAKHYRIPERRRRARLLRPADAVAAGGSDELFAFTSCARFSGTFYRVRDDSSGSAARVPSIDTEGLDAAARRNAGRSKSLCSARDRIASRCSRESATVWRRTIHRR